MLVIRSDRTLALVRWLSTLELSSIADARLLRGRFAASCYDLGVRSSWYIRDKGSHLERAGMIEMVLCCKVKIDMINSPA